MFGHIDPKNPINQNQPGRRDDEPELGVEAAAEAVADGAQNSNSNFQNLMFYHRLPT